VAGDLGAGAARDDEHSVSLVAGARARVVDEDITREDVAGRLLTIAAGPGPTVLVGKAVTKVLGADFLLAARIATAGSTLVESSVATSKKTLGDKVGAVTTVAAVAAVLTAIVGPWSAALIARRALVVGAVIPGLGIRNSSITVVGSNTSCKGKNSNNGLHVKRFVEGKKKRKKVEK